MSLAVKSFIKSRVMFWRKKNQVKVLRNVGGGVFFASLFFLLILGGLNLLILPDLFKQHDLFKVSPGERWTQFVLGIIIGIWGAGTFIKGTFSVYLHEQRHEVVSVLLGNKPGKMRYRRNSGHLEFKYTDKTAPLNAFIALAPYWFPAFTILTLICFGILLGDQPVSILAAGIAYGADLRINIRDIHRRQTDILNITGGYKVGLLYIFAMNLTLFTILAAWVSQGIVGLKYLLYGLWQVVLHIVSYYRERGL